MMQISYALVFIMMLMGTYGYEKLSNNRTINGF